MFASNSEKSTADCPGGLLMDLMRDDLTCGPARIQIQVHIMWIHLLRENASSVDEGQGQTDAMLIRAVFTTLFPAVNFCPFKGWTANVAVWLQYS